MVREYDSDREMVTVLLKTHDRVSVYRLVADILPDTEVMVIQAKQQADQLDHEPEQLVQLIKVLGEKTNTTPGSRGAEKSRSTRSGTGTAD